MRLEQMLKEGGAEIAEIDLGRPVPSILKKRTTTTLYVKRRIKIAKLKIAEKTIPKPKSRKKKPELKPELEEDLIDFDKLEPRERVKSIVGELSKPKTTKKKLKTKTKVELKPETQKALLKPVTKAKTAEKTILGKKLKALTKKLTKKLKKVTKTEPKTSKKRRKYKRVTTRRNPVGNIEDILW